MMVTYNSSTRRLVGRSGQVAGALLGIAAIVLGIIGLADKTGMVAQYLDAIAAIVLGVTLLGTGASVLLGYAGLLVTQKVDAIPSGGVMIAVYLAAAAIILGILALLQIHAVMLIAIAELILGIGVMYASSLQARLQTHRLSVSGVEGAPAQVVRDLALAAASPQIGAGLAAIVLGILAIVGFAPIVLTLIAAIALGVSELLSGCAFGQRLLAVVTPPSNTAV